MAVDADSPDDGELSEATTASSKTEQKSVDPDESESPSAATAADGDEASTEDVQSDAADYDVEADNEGDPEPEDVGATKRLTRFAGSPERLALAAGLVIVVALAAVGGWLGFRTYEAYQAEEKRQMFLAVGRQGAVNLTTIDWQRADADVQRILDSATGSFYDDFSTRSQPFVDVVVRTQSKTVGTVSEAGLESVSGDEGQVLVAVSVETTSIAASDQGPRSWRMRMSVQKVGDDQAKVSNVVFVP